AGRGDVRERRGIPGDGDGIRPQERAASAIDRGDVPRVASDECVQDRVAVHIDKSWRSEEDAGTVVRPHDRTGAVEANHARRVRRYEDAELATAVHVRDSRGAGPDLCGGDAGSAFPVPAL